MRFWHGMGYTPLDELPILARHAEALGFYGITLGDHWVTAETQVDRYEIAKDGVTPWQHDVPWPDPWVTFPVLAGMTTKLQFLTTVYILPIRDAFTAAKAISTASVWSRGRIHLGVGVGWQKLEFGLSGQPFHERGKHIDEQLEVLQKLWTGEMVEHHGKYYDFPRIRMLPTPVAKVPIYVGGVSPAAFKRAARFDGWEGAIYPWDEVEVKVMGARQARIDSGRPLEGWRMVVGTTQPTPERLDQLRKWGVTDYLKPPWTDGLKATKKSLAEKLEEMAVFAQRFGVGEDA